MRRTIPALLLAALATPMLGAQPTVRIQSPRATVTSSDRDRAMLGVSTMTSGQRDTLGVLVSSVQAGGPAEKAGIEEGSRLQSINGVNLKLSRDDVDDSYMAGVAQNRLTREMRKVRPGDEVTLEVWSGGRSRTVKVKTVSADDLAPSRTTAARSDDRAALGVMLNPSGSRRDTAGVFIMRVVEGGPAEKAGIVEGDRIASVNGVDVRVPREDAGDAMVASARAERLQREVEKLKAGDVAELVVVSGGRSRTVRVTTVRAGELPGSGFSFDTGSGSFRIFGRPDGVTWTGPGGMVMPRIRVEGDVDRFGPEVRREIERIGPEIRRQIEMARPEIHRDLDRAFEDIRIELDRIGPEIRREIERSAPRTSVRVIRATRL